MFVFLRGGVGQPIESISSTYQTAHLKHAANNLHKAYVGNLEYNTLQNNAKLPFETHQQAMQPPIQHLLHVSETNAKTYLNAKFFRCPYKPTSSYCSLAARVVVEVVAPPIAWGWDRRSNGAAVSIILPLEIKKTMEAVNIFSLLHPPTRSGF